MAGRCGFEGSGGRRHSLTGHVDVGRGRGYRRRASRSESRQEDAGDRGLGPSAMVARSRLPNWVGPGSVESLAPWSALAMNQRATLFSFHGLPELRLLRGGDRVSRPRASA